jgi:site-specific DNA-adenine methylase
MSISESSYSKRLDSLKNAFSSAIDEFYNTYIIHYTNPSSVEYTQIYAQQNGQIASLNSSLFKLYTDIQNANESLNKQISKINVNLEKQKIANSELYEKLNDKRGKELGAVHLKIESADIYRLQYLKNVTLLLGNLILIYILYRLSKKE